MAEWCAKKKIKNHIVIILGAIAIGGSDTMLTFLWSVPIKHETIKNMDTTFGHNMISITSAITLYICQFGMRLCKG